MVTSKEFFLLGLRGSDANAPQLLMLSFFIFPPSASEALNIQTDQLSACLSSTIIKPFRLCLYVSAVHAKADGKAASPSQQQTPPGLTPPPPPRHPPRVNVDAMQVRFLHRYVFNEAWSMSD